MFGGGGESCASSWSLASVLLCVPLCASLASALLPSFDVLMGGVGAKNLFNKQQLQTLKREGHIS